MNQFFGGRSEVGSTRNIDAEGGESHVRGFRVPGWGWVRFETGPGLVMAGATAAVAPRALGADAGDWPTEVEGSGGRLP